MQFYNASHLFIYLFFFLIPGGIFRYRMMKYLCGCLKEKWLKWPKMIETSGTKPLGGLILPSYTLTKQKKQTNKKLFQFWTSGYPTVPSSHQSLLSSSCAPSWKLPQDFGYNVFLFSLGFFLPVLIICGNSFSVYLTVLKVMDIFK